MSAVKPKETVMDGKPMTAEKKRMKDALDKLDMLKMMAASYPLKTDYWTPAKPSITDQFNQLTTQALQELFDKCVATPKLSGSKQKAAEDALQGVSGKDYMEMILALIDWREGPFHSPGRRELIDKIIALVKNCDTICNRGHDD